MITLVLAAILSACLMLSLYYSIKNYNLSKKASPLWLYLSLSMMYLCMFTLILILNKLKLILDEIYVGSYYFLAIAAIFLFVSSIEFKRSVTRPGLRK